MSSPTPPPKLQIRSLYLTGRGPLLLTHRLVHRDRDGRDLFFLDHASTITPLRTSYLCKLFPLLEPQAHLLHRPKVRMKVRAQDDTTQVTKAVLYLHVFPFGLHLRQHLPNQTTEPLPYLHLLQIRPRLRQYISSPPAGLSLCLCPCQSCQLLRVFPPWWNPVRCLEHSCQLVVCIITSCV